MYVPEHFRQNDRGAALDLIREVVLGELVTWTGSNIVATPVPMLYDGSSGEGSLIGHVARANPQWETTVPGVDALAIFRGPDAYVSPTWYPTKTEHGRVVPTWNYATVHVYGALVIHDDESWKRDLVTRLTNRQEEQREQPWSVSDAPADYVSGMLRAIVGVELRISRIAAKWKLSQNQPERNRLGVIEGLATEEDPDAREISDAMKMLPDFATGLRPS